MQISNQSQEFPLVSIIMNCHNGSRFLREAIESIYQQSYKNWEIVFFDNASTDNSADIANSFDQRLRYIQNKTLEPLYTARNKALSLCDGEVVAFLDCDDIWYPKKLELQVSEYLTGAKFVYGGYEEIDSSGFSTGKREEFYTSGYLTNSLIRRNFISIGTVLIDANLIRSYRFNPFYDLLGDFDLWVRISIQNKFTCVPQLLEKSRKHNSNLSDLKKTQWLKERRKFYREFLKKYNAFKFPTIFRYLFKTEVKGLFNGR